HTGLGKYGEDTLLGPPDENESLHRMFGERVESLDPAQRIGSQVRGLMGTAIAQSLQRSRSTAVIQEFGTYGPVRVFRSLRAENPWHHYGNGSRDHVSKQDLKKVFCPSDESWRRAVLSRGKALFLQALEVIQQ